MQKFKTISMFRLTMVMVGAMVAVGLMSPMMATAQDNSDEAKDAGPQAQQVDQQRSDDQDLATQIAELRKKVDRLESVIQKSQGTEIMSKPSGDEESIGEEIDSKSSMEKMDDAANETDAMEAKKKTPGGMGMMGGNMSGMRGKGKGMMGKGMMGMGMGDKAVGDKGMDMMRQGGGEAGMAGMAGSVSQQMKKMMLKMKMKKIELEMIELELEMVEIK